jgi:hypothetical protein
MISSLRVEVPVVVPKRAPMMGMSDRKGIPLRHTVLESRINPAIATVSPSLTKSVVVTRVLDNVGPRVALAEVPGALTSRAVLRVTDPDAEIRGSRMSDKPVLR